MNWLIGTSTKKVEKARLRLYQWSFMCWLDPHINHRNTKTNLEDESENVYVDNDDDLDWEVGAKGSVTGASEGVIGADGSAVEGSDWTRGRFPHRVVRPNQVGPNGRWSPSRSMHSHVMEDPLPLLEPFVLVVLLWAKKRIVLDLGKSLGSCL